MIHRIQIQSSSSHSVSPLVYSSLLVLFHLASSLLCITATSTPIQPNEPTNEPTLTKTIHRFITHSTILIHRYSILVSILSIVVGIIELLYGLWCFRWTSFIAGMICIGIMGFITGEWILPLYEVTTEWSIIGSIFICIFVGILGGLIFIYLRRFAVAVLGTCFGIVFATIINTAFIHYFFPHHKHLSLFLVSIICITLMLTYTCYSPRKCVLVSTSGLGSWLLIRGIVTLIDSTAWPNEFDSPMSISSYYYLYLTIWFFLMCLSLYVQTHRSDRLPMHQRGQHTHLQYFTIRQVGDEEQDGGQMRMQGKGKTKDPNEPRSNKQSHQPTSFHQQWMNDETSYADSIYM